MEKYRDAADLVRQTRPDQPVLAFRPHAVSRAARWFLHHFPGHCLYAVKANDSPHVLVALHEAGIRDYDVASVAEIERLAGLPGARPHVMHPVKSRTAIRRAFSEYGVRSFALDSEDELKKILEETGNCRELTLWVRVAVAPKNSKIPLDRKYGIAGAKAARLLVKARQACKELGITFHVGSQTATPDAYVSALDEVGKLIVKAGVVLDRLDVGGGFPSVYADEGPAPLSDFMTAISEAVERLPIGERCRLMCEPGRALVAEAESLIVRVDARRGNELFVNDGSYGTLFDAAHLGFDFPVRLVGRPVDASEALVDFSFWGPTCDTIDFMKGPFQLPGSIKDGDYIEVGNTGASGRALASRFNGYGAFEEAILDDEPMLTMYAAQADAEREDERVPA